MQLMIIARQGLEEQLMVIEANALDLFYVFGCDEGGVNYLERV